MPNVKNIHYIAVGYMERDGNFYYDETKEDICTDKEDNVTHWVHLPNVPIKHLISY